MNERIARLMKESVETTDRIRIKRIWRQVLAGFCNNEDQILAFLEEIDDHLRERIIRNIRAMTNAPFYPIAVMNLKMVDRVGEDYVFDKPALRTFKQIREPKKQFKLLKKLAKMCEDDYQQEMVLELLESLRLSKIARDLSKLIRTSQGDTLFIEDVDIFFTFVRATEKLTLG